MPEQAIVISDREEQRLLEHRRLVDDIRKKTGADLTRIALVRRKMATTLKRAPDDVDMRDVLTFMLLERSLGLDSLLNQIFWIERAGKASHQLGIDGLRSIADRSGTYAGSEAAIFRGSLVLKEERRPELVVPEQASVTVRKLVDGHVVTFVGTCYWEEFYPGAGNDGFMYRKMPRHMLGKDAEAQALRKGWPAQLGGVPYSSTLEVTEEPAKPLPSAADPEMYDRIFGQQDQAEGITDPQPGREQPAAGVPTPTSAALTPWDHNRRLSQEAEALGLRPAVLRNDTPYVQVEAYNAELQDLIDEARARL